MSLEKQIERIRNENQKREGELQRAKGREESVWKQLKDLGLKTKKGIEKEIDKLTKEVEKEEKEINKIIGEIEEEFDI